MERKRKKWKNFSGTRRSCNKKRLLKMELPDAENDGLSEYPRRDKTDYFEYMNSREWRNKRFQRLLLDEFMCQMCGQNGGLLNVHHLTYKRVGRERMSDLITLCPACHEKVHTELRKNCAERGMRYGGQLIKEMEDYKISG